MIANHASSDDRSLQMLADEQFAAMLQSAFFAFVSSRDRDLTPLLPPTDELFMQELSADPLFASYLKQNPHMAAQFGLGGGRGVGGEMGGNHGRNPMRPPAHGGSYAAAATAMSGSHRYVGGGSNSAVSAAAYPRPAGAVSASSSSYYSDMFRSMGSDLKKRFSVLSANFQSKAATANATSATASATTSPSRTSSRFLRGMFDSSRGAYGALPHAENVALNPTHTSAFSASAFSDETGSDTVDRVTHTEDIEIELVSSALSRSGIEASAVSRIDTVSGHSINSMPPGAVLSSNPVFCIGEDEDDELLPGKSTRVKRVTI